MDVTLLLGTGVSISLLFPDGAIVDDEFPVGTGVSWPLGESVPGPLGDGVPVVAPVGETVPVKFMVGDNVP